MTAPAQEESPLRQEATLKQRQAADPGASVWVSASAGSGKTKVLIDRLLNLLLDGVAPHRLLCLTYTNAAAAEMSNRLAAILTLWATAGDEALAKDLARLKGVPPQPEVMRAARRLFASVLDAPGGLKIQTLHAFAQSLLRRFPIEAGLAPGFQVMDERMADEAMEEALNGVLGKARDGGDPLLAWALACVTERIHELKFPELMRELGVARGRLRRRILKAGGLAELVEQTRKVLDVAPGATPRSIISEASNTECFDEIGLKLAAQALAKGSAKDRTRGQTLATWLAASLEERQSRFQDYLGVYLTKKNEVLATLATQEAQRAMPGLAAILETEAERLLEVLERRRAAATFEATRALLILGGALLLAYQRRKEELSRLDYDDLILSARLLLEEGAAWVLYKLDGGIDHVLIDEAQDTSPDQWAIVKALDEEFFAGQGAVERPRTIFAVGDPKQSIYSFQHADPREFEAMRARLSEKVPAAKKIWRPVDLNISFRSTRAVLDLVDAVFERPPALEGVDFGHGWPRHQAARQGQGGRVELWPPLESMALDEAEPWKPPVERLKGDSPPARLAGLLARRIQAMIGQEALSSQGRPVRAGDIMVLVRKRGVFVEELVRALKKQNVPAAGVDRMVLPEQMAVMDLLALGRFLTLPEDDLSLACVLKGPLYGLSEESLFELCFDRGRKTLWQRLRDGAGKEAFAFAYEELTRLLSLADFTPPHEFFAHLLGPLGARRRLLAWLGPEAEDPLDEFMALALAYESSHPPSLSGFLHWVESGKVEIKRDLEQARGDRVRIMTVHGAKGLQAPIVILPDTLQAPSSRPHLLWTGDGEDALLLWPGLAADHDKTGKRARELQAEAQAREHYRLLYVALTRAEDRLIVCGWHSKKQPPANAWHHRVREALERLGVESEDAFLAKDPEAPSSRILKLDCPQTEPAEKRREGEAAAGPSGLGLPDWARSDAPPEDTPPRPLAPSRPEGFQPSPASPLGDDQGSRFRRGRVIHRLLQTLPDLPLAERQTAGERFLARQAPDLDPALREAWLAEAMAVLATPGLEALFAPGSLAEAPLAGLIGETPLAGQVDRLAVTPDEILVADYKTNRPAPKEAKDMPLAYRHQMESYRALLREIWPGRKVRCLLVWTEGPRLMEVE
jgi:ATP-dependent helicase/nuclease subunit A